MEFKEVIDNLKLIANNCSKAGFNYVDEEGYTIEVTITPPKKSEVTK